MKLVEACNSSLEALKNDFSAIDADKVDKVQALFQVFSSFDHYCSIFHQLKQSNSVSKERISYFENELYQYAQKVSLLRSRKEEKKSYLLKFFHQYTLTCQRSFPLFWLIFLTFCVSTVVSYFIVLQKPAYASLFLDNEIMGKIIQGEPWFERLNKSPILGMVALAKNNITVALNAYIFSALAGLGGLYILVYNGFHLGAIFGFCQAHGFEDQLGEFVSAHGPLEISIIIMACFAGGLLGKVFYERPLFRSFGVKFSVASKNSLIVFLGVILWLVIAAYIEAFISPQTDVDFKFKVGIGLLMASVFYVITFYKVIVNKK